MDIETRVLTLERRVRRWRLGTVGCLLLLAGTAALAMSPLLPQDMKAGTLRARYIVTDKITLVDNSERPRIDVCINDMDQPCVWFYGPEGKTALESNRRLFLGVSNEGDAFLQFYNPQGEPCHYLTWKGSGEGEFEQPERETAQVEPADNESFDACRRAKGSIYHQRRHPLCPYLAEELEAAGKDRPMHVTGREVKTYGMQACPGCLPGYKDYSR